MRHHLSIKKFCCISHEAPRLYIADSSPGFSAFFSPLCSWLERNARDTSQWWNRRWTITKAIFSRTSEGRVHEVVLMISLLLFWNPCCLSMLSLWVSLSTLGSSLFRSYHMMLRAEYAVFQASAKTTSIHIRSRFWDIFSNLLLYPTYVKIPSLSVLLHKSSHLPPFKIQTWKENDKADNAPIH